MEHLDFLAVHIPIYLNIFYLVLIRVAVQGGNIITMFFVNSLSVDINSP